MTDETVPPPADDSRQRARIRAHDAAADEGSATASYRDCVEHAPYGVLVHDDAGRILLYNSRLETLTGFRREELPNLDRWIEKLYPDPAYRRLIAAARAEVAGDGLPRTREALITRKDGQRRMCRFTSATLPEGSRVVFIRDIHATAEFFGCRPLEPAEASETGPQNTAPVLCWVECGGELLLSGYNQAAAELAGAALETRLAARATDFFSAAPEMTADIRRCFVERGVIRSNRTLALFGKADPRDFQTICTFFPPRSVFVTFHDLTELNRAREQLADNKTQFAAFADILPEIVFETDLAGRITFLNRKGIERLGYTPEDWPQGSLAFSHLEAADRPLAEANFQRVMAGEYIGPNKYRVRRRDGETVPVLLMSSRVEQRGTVVGTRGFIVDITERERAEQALRVSEERLRMATEGARIGLWDWDIKTGRIHCNEEYFRLLGYAPWEFTPSFEQWLEMLHPEDRSLVTRRVREKLDADRDSSTYSIEYRLQAKDGSWRWIQDFGRVAERDAAGAPLRALGVHIDITARKRSEEALRASERKFAATFHARAGAAAVVNLQDGRFIEVNERVCELTGYGPEELIGHSATELGIWEDPAERRRLVALLTEQGLVRDFEYRLRRKSGERRIVSVSASVVQIEGQHCMLAEVMDITAQRRDQEALRLSEERLRLATEGSGIGLWDWDAETGAIHCNDIYFTMLGYAPQEFTLGHERWLEMVHPEDRTRALASLEAAKVGRSDSYAEEYRMRCKDGSWRWIADVGRIAARAADGTARRAIGIHLDVTERRKAEQALRASEQKFASTFHASAGATALVSARDGRFIDVNARVCEMTGYSREELIGESAYALDIWVDPEARRRLVRLAEEKGQVSDFTFHFRRKSGELRQGVISAAVVDIDGERCLVSEATDITEQLESQQALRLSEERLRMATEGANIGLWDWDLKTGAVYCNDQYFKMLGVTPDDSLPSFEWWREQIHPEDRERAAHHAQERLVEGRGPFSIDYRMATGDGSWRWIHDFGVVTARGPDGRPERALGIHIDISERRRAEEALKEANDELERRVAERTAALLKANRSLKQQVSRRLQVEKKLRAKEKQLKRKSDDLMEVNAALKVLLKKREEDRQEVEEKISAHLKDLVLPYLEKMKRGRLPARHQAYLNLIETNLKEVASPFAKVLSDRMYSFTPTEIQVANFIKLDKGNKEIAEYLGLSVKTIEYHRYNLRRKLGLIGKAVNLRSYLKTMS